MHETPSQQDNLQPTPKKSARMLLVPAILLLAIIIPITGLFLWRHSATHNSATNTRAVSQQQSLTLFYRDGKTVLWKSGNPADGDVTAFAAYARQDLMNVLGGDYQSKGAWQVTTTLSPSLQAAAQKQIQDSHNKFVNAGVQRVAFVAENITNGQVVSWVGVDGANNTDPVLQKQVIGSLALPLTYVAYMDQTAKGTDIMVNDTQRPLFGYPCTNTARPPEGNCAFDYDERYMGQITLYQAIAKARQVPAISAVSDISKNGPNPTIETIAKMGSNNQCYADEALAQETACYTGSAIGDGVLAKPQELVQAYATLANGGSRLPQTVVLGATLNGKPQTLPKPTATQVIHKAAADAVVAALSDSNASALSPVKQYFTTAKGTKTALVDGATAAGTSASSVQFSQKYVAGFWMSADRPLRGVPESLTLPFTAAWMNTAD